MKKWLKQTSTIGGLLTIAIAGVQTYQSGGDVLAAILAVLGGALLLVRDGKFLAGLCVLCFVGGTSCASVPIPKDAQISAATSIGCAVIEEAGCYDELKAALPGLNNTSCVEIVNQALTIAEQAKNIWKNDRSEYSDQLNKLLSTIPEGTIDLGYWDPLGVVDPQKIASMRNGKCSTIIRSLGVK